MNKFDLVAGTICKPVERAQPSRGQRVVVMLAGRLQRVTPAPRECACAHPDCRNPGEWIGDVTVTARVHVRSAPVVRSFLMPMVCNQHALAAAYHGLLPPILNQDIALALASEGFGPAQAQTELELRAA